MVGDSESSLSSVITRIELQQKRRQRYNIYIDEQYAFSVHEDILIKHQLSKGTVMDEARMQYITEDEERQQAYLQAIRFLSRKARSSKQLAHKLLAKDYKQETVASVIEKLLEQGYLDDQQYAKMLATQRLNINGKGKYWIQQELTAQGLAPDAIDDALAQIDDDAELQLAFELASKRWERLSQDAPLNRKRKIYNLLLRRGYSYSVVNDVLKRLGNEDDRSGFD